MEVDRIRMLLTFRPNDISAMQQMLFRAHILLRTHLAFDG